MPAKISYSFFLGLSLAAHSPALRLRSGRTAAWYFIVIVCYFSPCRAKNNTQRTEHHRQAKPLLLSARKPLVMPDQSDAWFERVAVASTTAFPEASRTSAPSA